MKIAEWRQVIRKYFPEYLLPAEIGLSVIGQLGIKDVTNPFGLVFVDRPSSGKTITLNFFSKCTGLVYATDTFTASAFVSHASNRKEEDLTNIDLLPRIKHKVFLVRDLAPIFGMRDDDLLKTMGILTRIFDGEGLMTDSGLYGQRGYRGDYLFMFIAASTPIRPRVWRVMGNFGSRLFFLNMDVPDKTTDTLAGQLCAKCSPKQKERKCRKATKELLDGVFPGIKAVIWDKENENKELLKEIATIAILVASLRGIVNFSKRDNEDFNFSDTQIEKPDRINQAFYNLARGHALICRRSRINSDDVAIVLKVALSSAPWERVKLFKLLVTRKGRLETDEIMDELDVSRPTALKLAAIFTQLKIIHKEEVCLTSGRQSDVYRISPLFNWFVSERFFELVHICSGNLS